MLAHSPSDVPLEPKDPFATEAQRLYSSLRIEGPIASFITAAITAWALWNRLPQHRLIVWLAACAAISVAMAVGANLPRFAGPIMKSGLPRLTEIAHLGMSCVFGSLLWISDDIGRDRVALWTALAALLAITAGVAAGLSSINRLNTITTVPMWTLTVIALVRLDHYILAIGFAAFGISIAQDQQHTSRLWRELIALRIRETKQAAENARAAKHDGLTGLLNRAGVSDLLTHERPRSTGMFVDLDHFKQVNDRFGHAVGDEVLCEVARRLRATVSASGTVARIGGDEFFVVFDSAIGDDEAHATGQKIIASLEEPFIVADSSDILISASIGFATTGPEDHNSSRLMIEADHAMLHAKRSGRRQVAPFTPLLQNELEERSGLESALRRAVRNQGLSCAAQPGFDLRTGHVRGVELLARWPREDGTTVPPSVFIPLAEEIGLIDELTEHMLETAGRFISTWSDVPQLAEAPVSVNVSPMQVAKGNLLEVVAATVERHRIPRHRLALEITESSTLGGADSTLELFNGLQDLGVTTAIDDFGTGYSSLDQLLRLPVTAIKIDRSLIAGLGVDPRQQAIMVAIRDLARVLGQIIIAEGVEHHRQVEALQSIGIHFAQGFGLMAPVPIADLVDQLCALDWSDVTSVTTRHHDVEHAKGS